MKASLTAGLSHEIKTTVTEDMSPQHLPVAVLSTPRMVGLIEDACHRGVQPHLDEVETTVGVHINVSHTGPAHAGEEVTVKIRVAEIRKRRLYFAVEVHSPEGPISTGTHERAVVDTSRFGST